MKLSDKMLFIEYLRKLISQLECGECYLDSFELKSDVATYSLEGDLTEHLYHTGKNTVIINYVDNAIFLAAENEMHDFLNSRGEVDQELLKHGIKP